MKTKFVTAVAALIVGSLAATTSFADNTTAGQRVEDATLVAKVKAELLRSPDVAGLAVNVDAKNGVVTLSGHANTETERTKAAQIAQTTSGVAKVDNKIMLKPDTK